MKMINKDVLVTEIEKKRDAALTRQRNLEAIGQVTVLNELIANELNRIITFINTLEVKEVDLEKEAEQFVQSEYFIYNKESPILLIAKHFFELGLSVNNAITAADRGTVEEIILALNTLGEEKMISYDKEIKWLNKIKEL